MQPVCVPHTLNPIEILCLQLFFPLNLSESLLYRYYGYSECYFLSVRLLGFSAGRSPTGILLNALLTGAYPKLISITTIYVILLIILVFIIRYLSCNFWFWFCFWLYFCFLFFVFKFVFVFGSMSVFCLKSSVLLCVIPGTSALHDWPAIALLCLLFCINGCYFSKWTPACASADVKVLHCAWAI